MVFGRIRLADVDEENIVILSRTSCFDAYRGNEQSHRLPNHLKI